MNNSKVHLICYISLRAKWAHSQTKWNMWWRGESVTWGHYGCFVEPINCFPNHHLDQRDTEDAVLRCGSGGVVFLLSCLLLFQFLGPIRIYAQDLFCKLKLRMGLRAECPAATSAYGWLFNRNRNHMPTPRTGSVSNRKRPYSHPLASEVCVFQYMMHCFFVMFFFANLESVCAKSW